VRAKTKKTHPNEPVPGLKPLLGNLCVVNDSKSARTASTKLGPETKGDNTVLVGLVQLSKTLREFGLGHVGAGGVENVDDHLAALEESVGKNLAGP
jgi:hypothetical protein